MRKQPTGIAWYTAEHFNELRLLFVDGHSLPATYAEWLTSAETQHKYLTALGVHVVKVYIDPVEFPNWCFARQLPLNSESRTDFVNAMALQAGSSPGAVH
jgi:hypothetical protein